MPGCHHHERRDEHASAHIGDQHDQARTYPVGQNAAHRDQHGPRHAIAGQDRAEENCPAVVGQDQPWQRHRVAQVADGRRKLAPAEQQEGAVAQWAIRCGGAQPR